MKKGLFARLLVVVVSLAILLAPAAAFADNDGDLVKIIIDDIKFSMGQGVSTSVDLTGLGLEITAGADETGRALFGMDVIANGKSALSGAVALENDRVKAVVNGLEKALVFNVQDMLDQMSPAERAQVEGVLTSKGIAEMVKAADAADLGDAESLAESIVKLAADSDSGVTESGKESIQIAGKAVEAQKYLVDIDSNKLLNASKELSAEDLAALQNIEIGDLKGTVWVGGDDISLMELEMSVEDKISAPEVGLINMQIKAEQYDDYLAFRITGEAADSNPPMTIAFDIKVDKSKTEEDTTDIQVAFLMSVADSDAIDLSFSIKVKEMDFPEGELLETSGLTELNPLEMTDAEGQQLLLDLQSVLMNGAGELAQIPAVGSVLSMMMQGDGSM